MTHTPSRIAAQRYLCILLGEQHYALPILSVQEIQAYTPPTPVPRMPAHVRGVTNLHGSIVPVIDLRQRLGMASEPYGKLAVTVFVSVASHTVGLVVDAAASVVDILPHEILPPPDLGDTVETAVVSGLARRPSHVIVLLDTEQLLRRDTALARSTAPNTREDQP